MADIQLTDEIRRAVHAEDCEILGHQISMNNAVRAAGGNRPGMKLANGENNRLPHLKCDRCSMVWLVLPLEGWTYEDAERKLYQLLRADSPIAKRITRAMGRRTPTPQPEPDPPPTSAPEPPAELPQSPLADDG